MSSYKEFIAQNDKVIDAFKDGAGKRVEALLEASAHVSESLSDEQWKAFEAAKRELILTLNDVVVAILRKVPKIQNEDTLGFEVQTAVVKDIEKSRGRLLGSDKEDASVASYNTFLTQLAALHKDKKDRPEGYPVDLDAQRLAALQAHHAFAVKNSYSTMISTVVNTNTLLTANAELILRPKRSFNTMM